MQLSLTILATESPPTRWCSSSEFSPLVLGADSTLLDSQPAVHRHCAAKARALKQTLVWTNVKSAGNGGCAPPYNKAGQGEKNPDQGLQFASLEPGDRMRRPAIIANTRHNAHTLSPSQNLPLFWLWGKMCGIERWKKNQEAWKLCGGFPVCAYNNIARGTTDPGY